MRHHRYPSVLFIGLSLAGWAQTQTISLSNSSRFRMEYLGSVEGNLIASEHRFGFDSSWVELSRLDPQGTSEFLAAYRFNDHLWFLFDGAYGQGGIVVSGTLTSSYVPHLVRFATDGSISWTRSFTGMQFFQTRFSVLLSNGFNDFAFTNADSFGGTGMYRARFDAETGDNLTLVQVTTDTALYFRAYCGAPVSGFSQVIGGSGVIANGDYKALLAFFDDPGCLWMKLYELGSVELQTEEMAGVASIPGAGFACAMNSRATETTTDGIFMLTDDEGQPVSGLRLSDPLGVNLSAIFRLPGGAFLVAGSTNFGAAMLFRISGTGELVWARRCDACIYSSINSFYYGGTGEIYGLGPSQIYEISPDGDICGFDPITSVSATPFVPVTTTIDPVNTASSAVVVGTQTLLPRSSFTTASVVCNETAIAETQGAVMLSAYPNPTEGMLRLEGISSGERIRLIDARGNVVFDGAYRQGIDVRALAPGAYSCLVPRTMQRVRVIKH